MLSDKFCKKQSKYWEIFLLLSEIVEIVCSPSIHQSYLSYLQLIIKQYISLRLQFFDEPLRPKHHFLSHYPYLIKQFGPLVKTWTLRFESKHTFFKDTIRNKRNFKNVTLTLSNEHERYQALLRLTKSLDDAVIATDEKIFSKDLYSIEIQSAVPLMGANLLECNKVTYNGITYKCGDAILYDTEEYQSGVKIGNITLIIIDKTNKNTYLLLKKWENSFVFSLRFYEFLSLRKHEYYLIKVKNKIHEPLHCYTTLTGETGIKLKHELVCKHVYCE